MDSTIAHVYIPFVLGCILSIYYLMNHMLFVAFHGQVSPRILFHNVSSDALALFILCLLVVISYCHALSSVSFLVTCASEKAIVVACLSLVPIFVGLIFLVHFPFIHLHLYLSQSRQLPCTNLSVFNNWCGTSSSLMRFRFQWSDLMRFCFLRFLLYECIFDVRDMKIC